MREPAARNGRSNIKVNPESPKSETKATIHERAVRRVLSWDAEMSERKNHPNSMPHSPFTTIKNKPKPSVLSIEKRNMRFERCNKPCKRQINERED